MKFARKFGSIECLEVLLNYMLRRHIRSITFDELKNLIIGKVSTSEQLKKAFDELFRTFPDEMEYYISPQNLCDKIMLFAAFNDPRKLKPATERPDPRKFVYFVSNKDSVFGTIGKDQLKKYVFLEDACFYEDAEDGPEQKVGYHHVVPMTTLNQRFGANFERNVEESGEMIPLNIQQAGFGNATLVMSPKRTFCIPIADAFRRIVTYLADDIQLFRRFDPQSEFSYCYFKDIVDLMVAFFKSDLIQLTSFVELNNVELFLDIVDDVFGVKYGHVKYIVDPFFQQPENWGIEEFENELKMNGKRILEAMRKIYPLTTQLTLLESIIEQFPEDIEFSDKLSKVEQVRNYMHLLLATSIMSESRELLKAFHNQGHCHQFFPICLLFLDIKKPQAERHEYCDAKGLDVTKILKKIHPCKKLPKSSMKCGHDTGKCNGKPKHWKRYDEYKERRIRVARMHNIPLGEIVLDEICLRQKGFSTFLAEKVQGIGFYLENRERSSDEEEYEEEY